MYWQRPMAIYVHPNVHASDWLEQVRSKKHHPFFQGIYAALLSLERDMDESRRAASGERRRRKERFNKNRAASTLNIPFSLLLFLSIERGEEEEATSLLTDYIVFSSVRPFSVGSHLSFVPITRERTGPVMGWRTGCASINCLLS